MLLTCKNFLNGRNPQLLLQKSKGAGLCPAPTIPMVDCVHSLRFAIDDVAADNRVKLAQLDPARIVAAILRGQIHVRAFGAAHLDKLPWSLFCHDPFSFPAAAQNLQMDSITQTCDPHKILRCKLVVIPVQS